MKIYKIVVHCSDTPDGRVHTAEDIHQWHKERGFDGIGYHYIIRINGVVDYGRPEYWSGAHVRGHNKGSLGVCLIGRKDYAKSQLKALRMLLNELTGIHKDAKIFSHYELDENKTCPNFDVKKWYYS